VDQAIRELDQVLARNVLAKNPAGATATAEKRNK
jgi:hypothetical protein